MKPIDKASEAASQAGFWIKPRNQLVIVFIVGLLLRVGCVLYYGPILTNDSTYYLQKAENILAGQGVGLPHRVPPVYSLFLAGVLAFSKSHWPIIWVQAVVGAAGCIAWAATSQRLFKPKLAFVLGLVAACYIPAAAFCVTLLRETLIMLGIALTTYFLVRGMDERALGWTWAAGAVGSVTVLCQPTFLLFPFWAGIAYWIHERSLKRAIPKALVVAATVAITIGLWATRNYLLTSRFIPIAADHIGYFFLIGIMDSNENDRSLTLDQVRYLGIAQDDPYNRYDTLRDHYWGGGIERKLEDGPLLFSRALQLARYQPGKYLYFTLKRLHRLWCKDLWAERLSSYLNIRPLDRVRLRSGLTPKLVTALIYAFGYASLIGMAVYWRRTLGILVPVVTVLSFHIWVHVETRYALPIHPYQLIFSVLGVMYLWQRLVQRRSHDEIKTATLRTD